MANRLKSSIKIYSLFFLSFFSLILILVWYNSCGLNTGFQSNINSNINLSSETLEDPNLIGGPRFILINSGKPTTNIKTLQLDFVLPFFETLSPEEQKKATEENLENYEMKITQAADCSGGDWEPFISNKTWPVDDTLNTPEIAISVKFKDKKAQIVSDCFSDRILYDVTGPQIITNLEETAHFSSGDEIHFIFSAIDMSVPVTFECQLISINLDTTQALTEDVPPAGGTWSDCKSMVELVSPNNPETYTFTLISQASETSTQHNLFIKATDNLGNSSTLKYTKKTIGNTIIPNVSFTDINQLPTPFTEDQSPFTFSLQLNNNPKNIQCYKKIGAGPSTNLNCQPSSQTLSIDYEPEKGINTFSVKWGENSTNPSFSLSYKWQVLD